MLVGPIFTRELVTAPRRPKLFVYRTVYAGILFGVMCTAWLILAGTQAIHNISDMARFGTILFQILAPLQLAIIAFFSALSTASAVSQEKDRKTLLLLLLTRLNSSELVLGKLMSSMLQVLVMLLAGLPVFALVTLFGGVSFDQVIRVFLVTLVTAFAAGSLGSTMALWREKTFQTLAMTTMALVLWFIVGEVIARGVLGPQLLGRSAGEVATIVSPMRAVISAARPSFADKSNWFTSSGGIFIWFGLSMALILNGLAILRCRVWNPSRELRQFAPAKESNVSIWGNDEKSSQIAESARQQHVDSKLRQTEKKPYRRVWDNPILWREVCTWAYGRKVIMIRVAYALFAVLAIAGAYWAMSDQATSQASAQQAVLPAIAEPLLPLFLVSLVIVNALAVTAVTTERDGRSLDLLLVTDLSPKEFVFGKLGGVFWVAKEMVLVPIAITVAFWFFGKLDSESTMFIALGLIVLNFFVAVLGIHCGMNHASSRSAISVSLGTVFFLFLGIATCILMMISFSGSFNLQLYPFLAFILGGGVGLYVSLGSRNPSSAILLASLLLPFATFYAIVSYFEGLPLAVFLTIVVAYSFTAAAMLVPALSEFDFAMGRSGNTEA